MKPRSWDDASYGFGCMCDITHLCGFFCVFCANNVGFGHSFEDSYCSCGEDFAPWEPTHFLHLSSLPPLTGSILGQHSVRGLSKKLKAEWSVVWILLFDLSTALLLSNKLNIFNFSTVQIDSKQQTQLSESSISVTSCSVSAPDLTHIPSFCTELEFNEHLLITAVQLD